ncbi:MAG TPA: PPC domain-containing protein [Polyangiaceae bacterium]|nr:PPC domain-containing protein [Polyangiaceae bacterium]
MRLRSLFFAALLPLSVAGLGACAFEGAAEEEESADVESDLTASRVHVLGAITPGQTLTAAYTSTPKYWAYSFTAQKGDVVDFWVRSPSGGDPYAYILGPSFATLKSNGNASKSTKDAHVKATLAAAGTYYVAFRDTAFANATLSVEFTGPAAPPVDAGPAPDAAPPAPALPTCTGTPRFPTTGPLNATSVVRVSYERDCDSFGVCTPWTKRDERGVGASTNYGITSVDPTRRAKVEIGLGVSTSQQGSSTYLCRATDRDANWSTQLDANGQGDTSMVWEDRCNIAGGSGGPSDVGPRRPVHISLGDSCMSITEVPAPGARDYGHQIKQMYIASF